ncbi:hypothetical protein EK21DRAFT_107080 [Setomelanomma holmii]|uniref:BTB domain-containing protein n=1 Tax=Setomelanomma holmii TaxID=210430 RepID=A0A9P4HL61_9PLEO|nr:hypothetical protein EK21DRAFT_107080 [Setomelanomma holmii]
MNNMFVKEFQKWHFGDEGGRPTLSFAFATLPNKCALLQALVAAYCSTWDDNDQDFGQAAQDELPRAFLRCVMKRFQELSLRDDEEKDGEVRCYPEHATEDEKKKCTTQHMRYDEKRGNQRRFVVVDIGPDHVRHHVHNALLTHHSEYFRNIFRGPWKEA